MRSVETGGAVGDVELRDEAETVAIEIRKRGRCPAGTLDADEFVASLESNGFFKFPARRSSCAKAGDNGQ